MRRRLPDPPPARVAPGAAAATRAPVDRRGVVPALAAVLLALSVAGCAFVGHGATPGAAAPTAASGSGAAAAPAAARAAAAVAPVPRLSPQYDTAEKREQTLNHVWQLVADRFYDPYLNGIDWARARETHRAAVVGARSDLEFYRGLKRLVRELGDSHTVVLTPRESAERRRFAARQTGAALGIVESRVVVTQVLPASPAARAGIRPGDVVVEMNGVRLDETFFERAAGPATGDIVDVGAMAPPRDAIEADNFLRLRAVRRLVSAALDDQAPAWRATLLREAPGSEFSVDVPLEEMPMPPRVEVSSLDDGIVLIRLTRFANEVRSDLRRALEQAAGARGVILDLRGNSGGQYNLFTWLAGQFMNGPRDAMESVRRTGDGSSQRRSTVVLRPDGEPVTAPVVILTDRRTASASELTATALVELRDAVTVGESTCGCVVAVRNEYPLPDGGGLRLSETAFVSVRGRRMEGEPLKPARLVFPTIDDLRAGRDPVLDEGRRQLAERLRRP
jgi:carboxyl-terminal processing protease